MEAIPQRVLKLVLEDDSCPIDTWLEKLRDKTTQARIMRRIDRLTRGNFGDFKGIDEDISELRLNFGAGYRIYYGRIGNTIVVLLGGSDKSKQAAAIIEARRLWRDFKSSGFSEAALLAWPGEEQAIEAEESHADAAEGNIPSVGEEGVRQNEAEEL